MGTVDDGRSEPGEQAGDGGRASRRVESILHAAEAAADHLRVEAERRAAARIDEASRAAANRVAAAEAEAEELVAEATRRAGTLHATAEAEAARLRERAESQAGTQLEAARTEAAESQRIAELFAAETRSAAEADARDRLRGAREVAADVLAEGTQLGEHLRELGDSLHANAERLLRDVALAHRAFRAALDRIEGGEPGGPGPTVRRFDPGQDRVDFGEIPEFVQGRTRRG